MGDFDNLAAEMTRRERNMREARNRATSEDAMVAWEKYGTVGGESSDEFTLGFDLGRDSAPTNYARIAVLQTEREVLRRQMERDGTPKNSAAPSAERYWAIDKEIREALT